MSDTQAQTLQDELATLKARADLMNVSYHPSIGVEKLREKVAAAMADKPVNEPAAPAEVAVQSAEETEQAKRARMRDEQLGLVRIRLSCMNPAKAEWEGEIFTVGNTLVGSVTKYVPFNADDGWHVPRILLATLQDRQCQIFVTSKAKNGVTVRQGKLIKEFAIEILPNLTADELQELARRQAMAQTAD
jgi:hypothetical protein